MKKSPVYLPPAAISTLKKERFASTHLRTWTFILLAILVCTAALSPTSSAESFAALVFGNSDLPAEASPTSNLNGSSVIRTHFLSPTFGGPPATSLSLLQEQSGPIAPRNRPAIVPDKPDYAPGETANIVGDGFQPYELVHLRVKHTDGTAEGGEGHEPWSVTTDENGRLGTTWLVNSDDSSGALSC